MKSNFVNILIVLIVGVSVVLSCSTIRDGKPAAERSISEFHSRYNEREFSKIYSESADEFKTATTSDQMDGLLAAMDRKLGSVKSSSNMSWRVGNFNLVTSVIMIQETEFTQGKGTETFTFKIDGDKAVLMGYNIVSNELILK